MLDILPALLWIIAAVIAVNICLITAIRGNLFSKKHRDVHPVRWSIIALIAAELVFMYLQARNGMHSEMERKLNQAVK